jgi:thioredoxin reductase (NADPH)
MKKENIVIIGSGPAGWTAAIYASRADLNPLVIEGVESGGQLMLTTIVENFPGFKKGIQGPELMNNMREQAKNLGVRIETAKVDKLELKGKEFKISYSSKELVAKTVIITTGASARWLNIPSENKFKGRGVSTCATCDGYFFKGKTVAVVGGGDAAMEEAQFLSKICKSVKIIHRKHCLRASEAMQKKIKILKNVDFVWNSEIKEFLGSNLLSGVKIVNNESGKESEIKLDGVFLAIGHVPNVNFISDGLVKFDKMNYIITDNTKTKTPGLFAAGDVQDFRYRQAITAAGSGCMAALEAKTFLEGNVYDKNFVSKKDC